jgi:hypothetical protein
METGRLSHNAATSNSQRERTRQRRPQPAAQWPPLRRPQPVPAGRPMRNSSRRIRGSNSRRRAMPQFDLRRSRPSAAVSPNRIRGTTGGSTTTTILSSSGLCAALSARCSGPMPMTIVSITYSGLCIRRCLPGHLRRLSAAILCARRCLRLCWRASLERRLLVGDWRLPVIGGARRRLANLLGSDAGVD